VGAQMLRASKLRAWTKQAGDKYLSNKMFFKIMPRLFALGSDLRRGTDTRYAVLGRTLFTAEDPSGLKVHFCERTRFRLYHYPGGVENRLAQLVAKYSCEQVSVSEGDFVIDVGANVGEFSCAVSPRAGAVLAIEPDPMVQEALRCNVECAQNVTMSQVALSDSDGTSDFYVSSKDADSSLFEPTDFSEVIPVVTRCLDTIVEERNIERVDFLKLEAEGWEPEILAGAKHTLSLTKKVAVDAGPERHGATTIDAVEKHLSEAGFTVVQRGDMVFGFRGCDPRAGQAAALVDARCGKTG